MHGDAKDHINTGPCCLVSGVQLPALPPGRAETQFPHAKQHRPKVLSLWKMSAFALYTEVIAFAFDELDRYYPLLSLEG